MRLTLLEALLHLNLYCDWLICFARAREEKNSSDLSFSPTMSESKSHFWFIVGRGARLSQLVSISKPIMISSFNSMPNQISLQNSNEIRWKKNQKRTFVFMSSTRYSFTKKWNCNFFGGSLSSQLENQHLKAVQFCRNISIFYLINWIQGRKLYEEIQYVDFC